MSLFSRLRSAVGAGHEARKPAARAQQIWSIGIFGGASPLDLKPPAGVRNPVLTHRDVSDAPATFVADPFIIRVDVRWYMFFEVMNRRSGRGEIGLASSADGRQWAYQHIVLAEPFHLSYPYVFSHQGEQYMVPESRRTREVRLYRAAAFPAGWRHAATLLDGVELVDVSVCRFNDRWWLFGGAGSPPFRADTLRLFTAPDLMGPWAEHSRSPIVTNDPASARPAGRLVVWHDRVIRYAQDCRSSYGMQVHAFEITRLSADEYRERPAAPGPLLRGSGKGWNQCGMHHADPHPLGDGTWIASVDGWRAVRV